jgi:hypothetical protein
MTTNKLTIPNIAKVAADSRFASLKESLIVSRDTVRRIRPKVLAYSEPLFLSYGFKDAYTGEVITPLSKWIRGRGWVLPITKSGE